MATSNWRPHGLIEDEDMESLYLAAMIGYNPETIVHDPHEYLTVSLWEYLFNKVLFADKRYNCASQVPPDSTGTRSCRLCIRHIARESSWRIFCFVKPNKARNQERPFVEALEEQALSYCQDFLSSNPELGMVYTCTLIGTRIRCWIYHKGGARLQGFWGEGNSTSHTYAEYLDIGQDDHREQIEKAFNSMRLEIGPCGARADK